jgi:curved DNA-binding protein CbpA
MRDKEEVNNDKRKTSENKKKKSNDLLLNFYEVLNVSEDSSLAEIKKQYRKLVTKYHPDHGGDSSLFALVQRAFESLGTEEKRKEYDHALQIERKSRSSNHSSYKKQYEDFVKLQDTELSSKGKDFAQLEFNKTLVELDSKHKFDRSRYDDEKVNPLTKGEINKRFEDLVLTRDQEDIELTPQKVFGDGPVNSANFNAYFDFMKNNNGVGELTQHTGVPGAWNNDVGTDNFTSINSNYGDLYDDGDFSGNLTFGSLKANFGKPLNKNIDENTLKNIKPVDYVEGHKVIDKNYMDEVQKRLKQREQDDTMYDKREMTSDTDWNTDSQMGGYGFMHQVGYTGKELTFEKDDEYDDLNDAYLKLLELRKKNEK